jgi:hypothetical protein
MATIAELFGVAVARCDDPETPTLTVPHENWQKRYCPFTEKTCDVTANRADRAHLDLNSRSVSESDRKQISNLYKDDPIPLAICSLLTKRQNEKLYRPWIVCPKRLLDLRGPAPRISPELRQAIPIAPGTPVRCWWEVKFRSRDPASSGFFEYTFDYLVIPYDGRPIGPPYIIEIMTSSTRGGGLTEHMLDVLLLRPQRRLRDHVDSPYTPNYRQVFERMLGQFFAKSEIAAAWGGRAVWLVQDVLVEYIEQTTNFESANYEDSDVGNVFLLVYRMAEEAREHRLIFDRILRGHSRSSSAMDFTRMLGLGFAPTVDKLHDSLKGALTGRSANWIDFVW